MSIVFFGVLILFSIVCFLRELWHKDKANKIEGFAFLILATTIGVYFNLTLDAFAASKDSNFSGLILISGVLLSSIILSFKFKGWRKIFPFIAGFVCFVIISSIVMSDIRLLGNMLIRSRAARAVENFIGEEKLHNKLDSKEKLGLAFKLKPALNSDDKYIVMGALDCLFFLGKEASPATEEVLRLIKSDNEKIQSRALGAICVIGPPAKESIPFLMELLREDYQYFVKGHNYLSEALVSMQKEAAPYLMKSLEDDNDRVVESVMIIFKSMSYHGYSPIAELKELLKSDKYRTRIRAVEALGRMESKHANEILPALIVFSKFADAEEKRVLKEALRRLKIDSKKLNL